MGKRRTYNPGECWKIIEDAGFQVSVFGSWFSVTINGRAAPDSMGVTLPRSGRVPIAELADELRRVEAYKKTLAG